MKHLSLLSAAVISLALFGLASVATAQTTFVSTRAGINANDTLDWGQLGSNFTTVGSPVSATSTGGLGLTASDSGGFTRRDQGPGWGGDFTYLDHLLWNNNNNTVTINFASAVSAAGLQINANTFGTWTATIKAYDASNNLLGSFSGTDVATNNQDNSALFLGVSSTTKNIAKITLDDPSTNPFGAINDFAINEVSLNTNAPAPVVPEGSSDLLMLSGLAVPCAGYLFRRLRNRK